MLVRLRRMSDRAIEAAAVLVTLALLGIVVSEAVLRNLDRSLSWSQELAQYLLVWLGFLGWMIASRRRSHIRITMLIDLLPRPARLGIEMAIQLAIMGLAVLLVWHGLKIIVRYSDIASTSLPIPDAVQFLLLPVLGAALIVQAASELQAAWRGQPMATTSREGQAS